MKRSTTAVITLAVASLFAGSLFIAGAGRAKAETSPTPAITSFGFSTPDVNGSINEDAKTISVTVPYGTDVTGLLADFSINGAEVRINGTLQYNGDSRNDFSNPVVYTVYSCSQEEDVGLANTGLKIASVTENINNDNTNDSNLNNDNTNDGNINNDNSNDNLNNDNGPSCTSVDYTVTVTVTVAAPPPPEITAFSFDSLPAAGVIDQGAKTIGVTVPYGTNVAALVPTVTFTGEALAPASGVAEDFTKPVTYTIDPCPQQVDYIGLKIAIDDECGVSYAVTVTVAAAPQGGGGGGGGGSGYVDMGCWNPVSPPANGFSILGANGSDVHDLNVQLVINGGNAVGMSVSNDPDFSGAAIEPYAPSKAWQLTPGEGQKLVYVRFYNRCNTPTDAYAAEFNYTAVPSENGAGASGSVLGVQIYADGTLIRGTDHRIYVIKNGKKVYIHSLEELAEFYFGLPILNVSDDVIAQYPSGD
jgi:hypothetical protein